MISQALAKPFLLQAMRREVHLMKRKTLSQNRTAFALVVWSILMVLPSSVMEQEQNFTLPSITGTLGNKDPGEVAEIKAHLHTASATGWQNLEGTGTLTYQDGNAHSATLYLMGSKHSRLDITMPSGTRSLRVSRFIGRFQDEKEMRVF